MTVLGSLGKSLRLWSSSAYVAIAHHGRTGLRHLTQITVQ